MFKVGDIVRFKDEQNLMDKKLTNFYKCNKEETLKVSVVGTYSLRIEGDYEHFIHAGKFIKVNEKNEDKMKRAVGEVFYYKGVKLKTVKQKCCDGCFFNENGSCEGRKCSLSERKDGYSVIFIEVKEESEIENLKNKKQDDLKEEIKSNNLIMEAQEKERITERVAATYEYYLDRVQRIIDEQHKEIDKLNEHVSKLKLTLQFALKL